MTEKTLEARQHQFTNEDSLMAIKNPESAATGSGVRNNNLTINNVMVSTSMSKDFLQEGEE